MIRKPVVTIVGRPNVGKSTLFNRLIGRRRAIVQSQPGVTRDRNYGDCLCHGKHFILIDTGGFEPLSEEEIPLQIRKQAQLAIEEADVIIFLVDVQEGLTPSDIEVADILRKTKKPVLTVVNKVDNPKCEDKTLEFYKLGVENIISISADHAIGINDLMDKLIEHLPECKASPKEDEEYLKIAVTGRPNVGKSSIINKILGENRVIVSEIPGTTRDSIDTLFTYNKKKYILVDTAGIRRKGKTNLAVEKYGIISALKSLDRCDIALILIDAVEGITAQDTKIAGYAYEAGRACIIIVNKWDLIEKDNSTIGEYTREIRNSLKYLDYAPIIFLSALTGQRVLKIFKIADEIAKEYTKKIATPVLNDILQKAVTKIRPASYQRKQIKFYYITQISTKPPTFLLFVNFPQGIHFSYLRYLDNQLREAFSFQGTPIRLILRRRK